MSRHYTYIFIEVALLLTLVVAGIGRIRLASFRDRKLVLRVIALVCLWTVVVKAAIMLNLWYYPGDGILSVTILEIPIEEYLMFVIHTLLCIVFQEVLCGRGRSGA